jgi:hypothetical protein
MVRPLVADTAWAGVFVVDLVMVLNGAAAMEEDLAGKGLILLPEDGTGRPTVLLTEIHTP